MVRPRMLRFLHREVRGLHEAAYVLAVFTLCAQVMALVRDRVFAHTFGVGETLDVFYAAFRIPDALYVILASCVSLFVLIPFFEEAERRGTAEVQKLLSDMFTFFSGALIVCAGVAFFFAPQLVTLLYGGFSAEMQEVLVPVVRVLLLQPLFLGVSNLCAAYVQVRGRFILYATAPILYNVGIVLGSLILYPHLGVVGLAWGVVLGAALHLSIQLPFIVREGIRLRVVWPNCRRVRSVVLLSLPRAATLSAQQVVLIVLVSLATYVTVGAVASFTFAWNLASVPLALIGVSYSVAAFPKLAKLHSNGERGAYRDLISTAAQQIIFWALPVTVLFVVLRAQIVRVLLGSGAFDWDATMMTGAVLAVLVLSLIAQGLVVLFVRACYAAGKTAVPFVLTAVSACVTITTAYWLLVAAAAGSLPLDSVAAIMRVSGVPGSELLLIAAAFSLGVTLNALLLLIYFEYSVGGIVRALAPTTTRSLIASFAAGTASYMTLQLVTLVLPQDTFLTVFAHGALAGAAGIGTWYVLLRLVQSPELNAALRTLRRHMNKTRIAATRGSIGES